MSSTKNLRKRLDALIQNGKAIKCSAETTLAWRSLQMAKAWLGKALGYQGNSNPYTVASTPGAIPPTADVAEDPLFIDPSDHLASVNAMRSVIQSEIESIDGVMPTEERQRHCYRKSLDYLVEAKMWYGFEVAEIREKAPVELKDTLGDIAARLVVANPELKDKIRSHLVTVPEVAAKIEKLESAKAKESVSGAKFDGKTAIDFVSGGVEDVSPSIVGPKPSMNDDYEIMPGTIKEFSGEELEAIVPINSKNLGNENQDSKKEQQGASKKKG